MLKIGVQQRGLDKRVHYRFIQKFIRRKALVQTNTHVHSDQRFTEQVSLNPLGRTNAETLVQGRKNEKNASEK